MTVPSGCLQDIAGYVASEFSPADMNRWDRHLIVCNVCRRAVSEEQRLRAVLAAGCPSMPGSLHAQLVALAAPLDQSQGMTRTVRPPVPVAGERALLPVLAPDAPTAPTATRASFRAALAATAVAGVGAVAVWSFSLSGPPSQTQRISTVVVPRVASSPAASNNQASVWPVSFGRTSAIHTPTQTKAESHP